MYPAYFDGRIHEINRNLAGLLLIVGLTVALFIDLAGVLNTVTVGRIKCYMHLYMLKYISCFFLM